MLIAVAVAATVTTITLWLAPFRGEVRVVFAGTWPNDSNVVSFTVTNSFKTEIVYSLEGHEEPINNSFKTGIVYSLHEEPRNLWRGRYTNYTGRIEGRGAETFHMKAASKGRWNVFVVYGHSWITSSGDATRTRLARAASGHGWTHISEWLKPPSRFTRVAGPEMIYNIPAPP